MPRTALTDARLRALAPRTTAYDVRDGKLGGFGVRVLPSGGKRFFFHCQYRGERIWRIVGDAETLSLAEARSRATETLAAIRRGESALPPPGDTLFEAVAETVSRKHERLWKPGTLDVNRSYLRNQILPHFAGREIADIERKDVRRWFASLHATPIAADRSMPVLSVIMREAEAMGLRPEGSNPCRGIRRNRRKGRERFLSDDEIRWLSAHLSAQAGRCPQQVAAVRLLLLTGCRKGEILTLRRTDYREGRLLLRAPRPGRGRCRSAAGPAPFSTGSLAAEALTYFPRHSIPPGRAVTSSRYGIGSDARRASRRSAFTTCDTRWRATPP